MKNNEKSWKKLFYEKKNSEYRQKAFEAGEMKKPNFDDSSVYNYIERDIRLLNGFTDVIDRYEFEETDKGEPVFHIYPKISLQGDYDKIFLFVDEDEHAILVKGPYCIYIFEFIEKEYKYTLLNRKESKFYELDEDDNIVKEYMAKVVYSEKTSELANIIMKVKWSKSSRYAITSV